MNFINLLLAQAESESSAPGIYNPALPEKWRTTDGGDFLASLIASFLHFLLIGAGIAALFYLLLGGLQWITSGGDKAGVEAAREKITAAIIGLVIVASVFAFINIIAPLLGLDFLQSLKIELPSIGETLTNPSQ